MRAFASDEVMKLCDQLAKTNEELMAFIDGNQGNSPASGKRRRFIGKADRTAISLFKFEIEGTVRSVQVVRI